jgi:putative holliday junction resolvase
MGQRLRAERFDAIGRSYYKPYRYTGSVTKPVHSMQPEMQGSLQRRHVLGIDYGRARIGLALADAETAIAQPLATLDRINRNEDMRRLREIVRDHGVKQIVVGLPLRLDGTRGDMAEEASRFAERVRKQLAVPVQMIDERLTSWEAERLLEEQMGKKFRDDTNARRKSSRARTQVSIDAMAAAVILKEYLEQQSSA